MALVIDGDEAKGEEHTDYPEVVRADLAHKQGIYGSDISIAFIDTGIWDVFPLTDDRSSRNRLKETYDAIEGKAGEDVEDRSGHGSHVTGVAVSSLDLSNRYNGLAPRRRRRHCQGL